MGSVGSVTTWRNYSSRLHYEWAKPRKSRALYKCGALRPLCPRVTFLSGKVTKAILPRKARRLRRCRASRLASGGAHTAHPCAGCAHAESLPHPFGLDFGLSSTLARLRGGSVKLPWFCGWAPYGAPKRRKPLAESPQGRGQDAPRRPSAQGCAVGRPPSQRRVRERGCRAIRVRLSFGNFSLAKQRKVTCRGSATHK